MSRRKKRPLPRLDDTRNIALVNLPLRAAGEAPSALQITGGGEDFELQAEEQGAEGQPKLRKFSMTAYTGGAMDVGFGWPVIVDLEGVSVGSQTKPILMAHDSKKIVGHSEKIDVSAQRIKVSGVISGVAKAAKQVMALAANGFPWQASIGASVQKREFVESGQTVKVNGRQFTGPVIVARQTKLGEVSFVPIGADQNTSATVAAQQREDGNVKFEQWLTANGFDAATLTEAQKTALKAAFDLQNTPAPPPPVTPAQVAAVDDPVLALRANAAKEMTRISEMQAVCAGFPEIAAKAVADGWDATTTKLAVSEAKLTKLRAERPAPEGGLGYVVSSPEANDAVLECAVLQAGRSELFYDDFYTKGVQDREGRLPDRLRAQIQNELKARYPDQVQQAAHTLFKDRIGLQQLLTASARPHGYRGSDSIRDDGDLQAVLRQQNWIRADGASTASISNVLANVLNKFLLQGYLYSEQSFREISATRPVKDFKPTKAVNLFGDFQFHTVPPSGELNSADLQDQAFANQAKTTGRILTISRQTIINDDLGALTTVPMLMGRGAGLKLNDTFWTLFLNPGLDDGASTNFFAATHTIANQSGNSNLSSGGGSALSSAGLTAAVLLFDNQVDPKGFPLGIDAEILLYPPDLEATASELMRSNLVVSGNTTKAPNINIWMNRFRPVKSRYMNKSAYTGNSTTAWYLLANPSVIPVVEICYLNGQELPTVQTASPDFQFNMLGISFRGFFDFGVAMQNFRGGVKSAGS